jgi:hypothetical protein
MSKLEAPVNANYAATVVEIKTLVPLKGRDRIVGAPLFGSQAIVGIDTKVGDIGLYFPAETQLSDRYAHYNNLYRHGNLNADESQQGYFDDNRRVKAIKLGGHRSDAIFMPLSSLRAMGIRQETIDSLKPGDTFDQLDGAPICKKYLNKVPGVARIDKNASKKFIRVENKMMPEHYDTDNYWRNEDKVPDTAEVVITQKLHGTSIRIGRTVVARKLSLIERIAKRLGVRVAETEFDAVYGSRKVIKDANNPNQNHFYDTDLWTEIGKRYDSVVPENFLVYGEVIGWVPGTEKPIQKGYTYDLPRGEAELYVYRVAVITNQGRVIDLSWDAVKRFCDETGLKYTPELWRGPKAEFVPEEWIDVELSKQFIQAVLLSDQKSVDEGVVIRTDAGAAPYLLKAKSPIFLQWETRMLDEEAEDIEAEESVAV